MRKQINQVIFIGILSVLVSCRKETAEMPAVILPVAPAPIEANASYKITITGTWASPQHTIPPGFHFTKFVGLVHSPSAYLFRLGAPASLGMENVAEVGNDIVMNTEMDNLISSGKASNKFNIIIPGITGNESAVVNVSAQHSLISFASMIAPSPDWFTGIDSYDLIQQGKWVSDITINVYGFDAGTEDGNVFGYNNPTTTPQQNVSVLTPSNASVIANGNAVIAPFATVRFIKQ